MVLAAHILFLLCFVSTFAHILLNYYQILYWWWVNQAYSRLSTTHGHITDCKLDSVVYAGEYA